MTRIVLVALVAWASLLAMAKDQAPASPSLPQIKMTTYVAGIIRKGPNWLAGDSYSWFAAVGLKIEGESPASTDDARAHIANIVSQIRRADYQGDRAALKTLNAELTPFLENPSLARSARYWRGFALWRRAINGFNDNVDPTEQKEDLQLSLAEFESAAEVDPTAAEPRIGALSCVSLLAFSVHETDPARVKQWIDKGSHLRKDLEATAPENPRYWWVVGPNLWYTPAERGGGQARAMASYEKGLKTIRKRPTAVVDPLDASWGEPELLMNLAWSNLNRETPDLDAAEAYANQALARAPEWHYVRDILLPQIQTARKKFKPAGIK